MRRRTVGLGLAGILAAGAVAIATPAAATISTPPPSVGNASTTQVVTVADSNPATPTYTVPPQVQLTGPGSGTDTYTDTGTTVTPVGASCTPGIPLPPPLPPPPPICVGGTSSIASTFNLAPGGLPAGPGVYTLNVCVAACPVAISTTSLTITGAPPAPTNPQAPFVVPSGQSKSVSIKGTGFSKGNTVTGPSGVTFTPANPQGTATALNGTIHVAASVPDGVYDLTVKDTTLPTAQTGVCTGCLIVGKVTPQQKPSKLTLKSPSKVKGGKRLKIGGRLTSAGSGVAHQVIVLYGQPDGGKYAGMGSTHTDSQGNYRFSITPFKSVHLATYFFGSASSPGKAGAAPALSQPIRRVVLVPSIKAKAKKSTSHLKPLTVKGKVKPVESAQSVSVLATHAGKRVHLGHAKLKGGSHFRLRTTKLTKAGNYKLVVKLRAGHGHAAARSKPIKIRRT